MSGMLDVGYDTLTIIVSTAGLLWLFVRQTNRQIDALRTDVTRQLDAQGADTARQFAELRADFRAVLPRAAGAHPLIGNLPAPHAV